MSVNIFSSMETLTETQLGLIGVIESIKTYADNINNSITHTNNNIPIIGSEYDNIENLKNTLNALLIEIRKQKEPLDNAFDNINKILEDNGITTT